MINILWQYYPSTASGPPSLKVLFELLGTALHRALQSYRHIVLGLAMFCANCIG